MQRRNRSGKPRQSKPRKTNKVFSNQKRRALSDTALKEYAKDGEDSTTG